MRKMINRETKMCAGWGEFFHAGNRYPWFVEPRNLIPESPVLIERRLNSEGEGGGAETGR